MVAVAGLPGGQSVARLRLHLDVAAQQVVARLHAVGGHLLQEEVGREPLAHQPAVHVRDRRQDGVHGPLVDEPRQGIQGQPPTVRGRTPVGGGVVMGLAHHHLYSYVTLGLSHAAAIVRWYSSRRALGQPGARGWRTASGAEARTALPKCPTPAGAEISYTRWGRCPSRDAAAG